MKKTFYSVENAAKEIGISRRHFSRLAERAHIEPAMKVPHPRGGADAFFYTHAQVEELLAYREAHK